MTLSRIEKIRAILQEQDKPKETPKFATGALYPHWQLDPGQESVIRILPDGDSSNPLPWVESQQINLIFPGILGEQPQTVRFKVPCVEMWGLSCPILGRIRKEKWFDDEDLKSLGSQYWKKKSWLMQGFIVSDGINEEETPENPIRRFIFSRQIFNTIRSGFADPELIASIDDFDEGIDFIIKAEANGQWNDYGTSKFKFRPRSLSEAEREAIENFGLGNIAEFRPKKPTDAELDQIFEMFEASVNGEFYDAERWGHLPWRPRGVEQKEVEGTTETASPAPKPAAKPTSKVVEESDDDEVTADNASSKTQEILAKIRAQQTK